MSNTFIENLNYKFVKIINEDFKDTGYNPYADHGGTEEESIKTFLIGCWEYFFSNPRKVVDVDDKYETCLKDLKDYLINFGYERIEYLSNNDQKNVINAVNKIHNLYDIRSSFKYKEDDVIPEEDQKHRYSENYVCETVFIRKYGIEKTYSDFLNDEENWDKYVFSWEEEHNLNPSSKDINYSFYIKYKFPKTGSLLVNANNEYINDKFGNLFDLLSSFEKCLSSKIWNERKALASQFFKNYFYKGLLDRYRTVEIREDLNAVVDSQLIVPDYLNPKIYSYLDGKAGTFSRINTIDLKPIRDDNTDTLDAWTVPFISCDYTNKIITFKVDKDALPNNFNTVKKYKSVGDYAATFTNAKVLDPNSTAEAKEKIIYSLCFAVNVYLYNHDVTSSTIYSEDQENFKKIFDCLKEYNLKVSDITFDDNYAYFEINIDCDLTDTLTDIGTGILNIQGLKILFGDSTVGNYNTDCENITKKGYVTQDFSSYLDDREIVTTQIANYYLGFNDDTQEWEIRSKEEPKEVEVIPNYKLAMIQKNDSSGLIEICDTDYTNYFSASNIKYIDFIDYITGKEFSAKVKEIRYVTSTELDTTVILDSETEKVSKISEYSLDSNTVISSINGETATLSDSVEGESIVDNDDQGPDDDNTIVTDSTLLVGSNDNPEINETSETLTVKENTIIEDTKYKVYKYIVLEKLTYKDENVYDENVYDEYLELLSSKRRILITDVCQEDGNPIESSIDFSNLKEYLLGE